MSKIDDLKLRKFSLQSQEAQAMMAATTSASNGGSPIDGGSLKEVVVYGSACSGADFIKCSKCGTYYRKNSICPCSGSGSYNWGSSWYSGSPFGSSSSSGSGYGSNMTTGKCRVVESSIAPAIGATWATGEIVTAVTLISAGMAMSLFAIMLCFKGDTVDRPWQRQQCIDYYADHCNGGPCDVCLQYCITQGKLDSRCSYR